MPAPTSRGGPRPPNAQLLRFSPAISGSGLQTWGMEDTGSLSGLGPRGPPGSSYSQSTPTPPSEMGCRREGVLSHSGSRRLRCLGGWPLPSPATCVPFSDRWACGAQTLRAGRGTQSEGVPGPPEGEGPPRPRALDGQVAQSGFVAGRGRCAPWWLISTCR